MGVRLKDQLPRYSNSALRLVLDEWIHSEVERGVLYRSLADDIPYEKLAEEFGISRSEVARIMTENIPTIKELLPKI